MLGLDLLTRPRLVTAARGVYAAAAVASTLGAAFARPRLHAGAKHVLAPALAVEVAAAPEAWAPASRTGTIGHLVGLAGSAAGDHVMLAESTSNGVDARRHLRRGAACFSGQQVALLWHLVRHGARPDRAAAGRAVAALAALGALDAAVDHHVHRGETRGPAGLLPDPVLTGYGILLATMASLASKTPRTAAPGALFLASDAVIIGRQPRPAGRARHAADGVVMGTYTTALAGLVRALPARAS